MGERLFLTDHFNDGTNFRFIPKMEGQYLRKQSIQKLERKCDASLLYSDATERVFLDETKIHLQKPVERITTTTPEFKKQGCFVGVAICAELNSVNTYLGTKEISDVINPIQYHGRPAKRKYRYSCRISSDNRYIAMSPFVVNQTY